MFGWINDCTESLVVTKFGIEKWRAIKEKAGCDVDDGAFIRHQYYDDKSTISLVVAASDILGISVDDVLEAFGQHFMEFTRHSGYDNMLSCQGSTLRLWLSNLNALHDHLQSSLPSGFVAPVFWCEDDEEVDGSILLHYYSERGGLLTPIVVGVVKEVARYHFDLEITMQGLQKQNDPVPGSEDASTYEFSTWRIRTKEPSEQWKLTTKSEQGNATKEESSPAESAPLRSADLAQCPFKGMSEEFRKSPAQSEKFGKKILSRLFKKKNKDQDEVPQHSFHSAHSSPAIIQHCPVQPSESSSFCDPTPSSTPISMSGDLMKEVFPYHVVVDGDFGILQIGNRLANLIGAEINLVGRHIDKIFEIKRPVLGSWDWSTLHKLEDQTFFLQSMTSRQTKLKANIIHLSASPKQVMFVVSPDAKNVAELTEMNLTMSDLPLHSFQRDAVFLGEHMHSEVRSAHKLDKLSKKLSNERNLSNTLLYSMIPQNVAELLRNGKTFEPDHHDEVTLFFSDVVGFTAMCAELPPWDIIDMLNRLYTVMDYLAAKFNLYKVETIGDAYMCCSGLPDPHKNHAEDIANFSIAVKECVKLVTSPLSGQPIRLRIGIHSGACMSGVVGTLTPHYCLFGDMINTTSRHESTGEPDKIQASSITYGRLCHFTEDAKHYNWTPRGLIDMKGKGQMYTYWLDSGGDTNPHVGPEPLNFLVEEVKKMLETKIWKKRKYFQKRASGSTNMTEFVDTSYQDNVLGQPDENGDRSS
mmetsp:Transcript_29543/g.45097  ORF Transcript_29543/g.45097 Transcript_29543/m.45097 type:complete len:753 (-) Transcript_29543:178-2436(-)|eukprot:CAMPEP_0194090462 /NCGR_PEP_ID=MMETSP0149-20130528/39146_1 /TAXON_ID=122233 /ORGANISM="Chaetoceros debilis, Strain MM31A-1" /LENGTH=752 /DNA_ID=CAMNT_0038774713 /DNA_START=115 /DNA_END=2376 /DNA_ORIENTATION=-